MEEKKRRFPGPLTKKRQLILLAALLAAAILLAVLLHGSSGGPMIKNGDFSQLDPNGMPKNWSAESHNGLQNAQLDVTEEADGSHAAHIVNRTMKDTRFFQTISVQPDTLYRLRGLIRADCNGGWGANLSVEGIQASSEAVYETDGQWKEVFLYGRTLADQYTLTIFVRLGGYSGESVGEAWFRDISLEPVETVPNGYIAQAWGVQTSFSGTASTSNGSEYLVLFSVLYLILFCFGLSFLKKPADLTDPDPLTRPTALMILGGLLALALGARIAAALIVPGYDVDIGCFQGWAERMAAVGPTAFYQGGFCDYPPGYLWVLWVLGGLGRLFGCGVTEFMVKLPPILADMALCALIYWTAEKRMSRKAALALSGLYAFNPLIFVTGAAWGQADALMVLTLFLTVLFAVRGKWTAALPCFVVSVLFKPQALMFGPLGVIGLILYLVREIREGRMKKALINTGLGLLAAGGAALIVALPFSVGQTPGWLITLYKNTMGSYAYATVNSCNLYFLLGKNWAAADTVLTGSLYIPALAWCLIALPAAAVAVSRRAKRGVWRHSSREGALLNAESMTALACGLYLIVMAAAGRLTYGKLGTCMVVFSVILSCVQFFLSGRLRNLPIYGAVCLIALFNTGAMMHERYLVPAAALLILGYILQKKRDNRLLWLALGVTVSCFLNVSCVLNRNIRIGGSAGHLTAPLFAIVSDLAWLEYLSAFLSVVMCALAVSYGTALCREGHRELPPVPEKARHFAAVLAVTAVYAVVAFTNLGSMKAPQKGWTSLDPDEQVVLDLGYSRSFHLAYFGGIHEYDSDFTVEISSDGETWDSRYTAGMKIGDCFKWKYLSDYEEGSQPADLYGRYIRITADHYDLALYELLPLDPYTHAPLSVSMKGTAPSAALVDEAGEAEPQSAWQPEDTSTAQTAVLFLPQRQTARIMYSAATKEENARILLETSVDMEHWVAYVAYVRPDSAYTWHDLGSLTNSGAWSVLSVDARYLRVTFDPEAITLYEISAYSASSGDLIPLSVLPENASAADLIDEPDTMEGEPGWYNSTYFDEIYHARTGFELLHHMSIYEWTHPPMGKVFMSWCISLFGMTPFGWRFAGALAGVLMLPGLYLIARLLTKKHGIGMAAMLLMAFDLMHYTQTRIATIDSFVVLFIIWMYCFMLKWFFLDYWKTPFWKTLVPLFLSGLMLGFGIASKWTGVYAGLGLAVLFFWGLIRHSLRYPKQDEAPSPASFDRSLEKWLRPLITVGCCFVFFIFIPLAVYYCSYIPFFDNPDGGGVTVMKVIEQAVGTYFTNGKVGGMLGYHGQQGLGMDHYFYSPWYQWPLIAKPMWYASGSFDAAGYKTSITALGNPAVWWVGAAALLLTAALWVRQHITEEWTVTLRPRRPDVRPAVLLICFFAQYLPWMLVPRGTYIYHYFPCVPFIILCTALCLDRLGEKRKHAATVLSLILLILAAALFVFFFPYASGISTAQSWMDACKWFRNWLWY